MNYVDADAQFSLEVDDIQSVDCVLWDFGDGTKVVMGDAVCTQSDAILVALSQGNNTIPINHVYTTTGTYTATVRAWGSVSILEDSVSLSVASPSSGCTFPVVSIQGMGDTPETSRSFFGYHATTLLGTLSITCDPIRAANIEWTVKSYTAGVSQQPTVFSSTGTIQTKIPAYTLTGGFYEVQLAVHPEGSPLLLTTAEGYLTIVIPALEAVISGGTSRSVPAGQDISLDGVSSVDLGINDGPQGLSYTWHCGQNDGSTIDVDDSSGWASATPCFSSQTTTALASTGAINTVPSSQLTVDESYIIKLTVSKDTRSASVAQQIDVLPDNSETILITCLNNCGEYILVNKETKFEASCATCASTTEALSYSWRVYQYSGGQYQELSNTAISTTTGTEGRYLAMKEGVFLTGEKYQVRLEYISAFATYEFQTNVPPQGGTCTTDVFVGYALETEFTFTCVDWVDPDDDDGTTYFRYDFKYRKMGADSIPLILATIEGVSAVTQPLLLPSGLEAFGYDIEIYVEVTDELGATATSVFTVQVQPIRLTSAELLNSNKLDELIASNDASSILLFVAAADNVVSQQEDVYYSTENYEELTDVYDQFLSTRERLIGVVMDLVSSSGLQSPDMCMLASQTMEGITTRTDTLSDSAKADVAAILSIILDSQLKTGQGSTTEDQRVLATSLLNSITSIQNTSRVEPTCPGPGPVTADVSPEERQILEELALQTAAEKCHALRDTSQSINGELLNTMKKMKQLVLAGAVPGEAPFNYSTPEFEMTVFMVDSATLTDTQLDIGDSGFVLPTFGDELATDKSGVEVLLMTANDYAFDDSAVKVKSQIISLTLSDDTGHDLTLNNLVWPVVVRFQNSEDKILIPDTINYERDTVEPIAPMYYHKITVNETGVSLAMVVTPLDGVEGYTHYISVGDLPNETHYDMTGNIPKGLYPDERDWTIIFDTRDYVDVMDENGTIYLGLIPKNFSNEANFNISMFAPSCVYYDEDTSKWKEDGCWLSDQTSVEETVCLCNHLTMFASNWFVPPNTIDFSTVFDDGAEKLLENIHVFITMIVILVLYLLLAIVLRRYDKRDVLKWGVSPLTDNIPDDTYHYHITVHTGMRSGGGTESNVFFMLGGEYENTEVRKMEDTLHRGLTRGSVNNYLLSVPDSLGSLLFLRIWHDNSAKSGKASWFLDRVVVRDIQTNQVHVFLAERWLAVDKDDGQLEVMLPAATEKDLANFQYVFSSNTREDMSDGHLWFSLVSRPTRSRFTRVQRLSCCLALLFATMIANAMWYRAEENVENTQMVRLGPFTFTPQQVFISLASSVVSVPISIIIVTLFRKVGPKPTKKKAVRNKSKFKYVSATPRGPQTISGKLSDTPDKKKLWGQELDELVDFADDRSDTPRIELREETDSADGSKKKKKKPFLLPWWCTYIAWFLVALVVAVSGTFTMLYSFQWGGVKSSQWLTAFLLSFVQSIVVIQPIKVLGIAVVLALVIKKPKVENEMPEDEELDDDIYQATKPNENLNPSAIAHRKPYKKKAIDKRHLEKLREERAKEVKMWAIIREIVSYLLYILVVSTLTYDNKDIRSFQSKQELTRIFVTGSFDKIKTMSEFWKWSEKILVPNMYAETWYNTDAVHWSVGYFIDDKAYFRIGSPRLRLARVKKGSSCSIESRMEALVSGCYGSYGISNHDDGDYSVGWIQVNNSSINDSTPREERNDPWIYRDTLELDGIPIMGNIDTYSGGGYVADLGTKPEEATAMLDYLQKNQWLDRSTRALLVEFNLFNPSTNLFSVVNLLLEFPASGGTVPYPLVQTLRLYNYVGGRAIFRLTLDILFVAFTIYFLVTEVRRMKIKKKAYFRSFWNIMEIINIVGSFTAFSLYAVHYAFTRLTMSKFHQNKDKYTNFQYILNWDDIFGYVLGFLVFLSMIKFLKLLRFNKKVTELMTTLDVATKPLLGFFLFFSIIYVAFAQFCLLVFGRMLLKYATFVSTLESLFAMMLMNFNYEELQEAHGVLGPLFFLLYVIVLAFVIINVLVAILNESFNTVKNRNMLNSTDYQMVDYMMKQFKSLISFGSEPSNTPKDTDKKQVQPSYQHRNERRDTIPALRLDAWNKKSPVTSKSIKKSDIDVYDSLSRMPSSLGHYTESHNHSYDTKF